MAKRTNAFCCSLLMRAFILIFMVVSVCLMIAIVAVAQEKPIPQVDNANQVLRDIRTPDILFVPTPYVVVDKMLELAEVKKSDVIYDLGCGDGRIVIKAATRYGCHGVGYDIDPARVIESMKNVKANNVQDLVRIEQKDIFTLDLSKATVITLYLLSSLNVQLIPQLQNCKPGTRIVSHDFNMQGIATPNKSTEVADEEGSLHQVYLWITPLKMNE